jgi:hypothetical protein
MSQFFRLLLSSVILTGFLGCSLLIASLTQTGWSLNWVYADRKFQVPSCASGMLQVGNNQDVTGPYCKVLFWFQNAASVYQDTSAPTTVWAAGDTLFGYAIYPEPCTLSSALIPSSECTYVSWSASHPPVESSLIGCSYNLAPVCDSEGKVFVGDLINIAGILSGMGLIVVLYFVVFLGNLCHRRRIISDKRIQLSTQKEMTDMSKREMTRVVEKEWSHWSIGSTAPNSPKETIGARKPITPTKPSQLPHEMFKADSWRQRLSRSLGADARARRQVALLLYKFQVGISVLISYFVLVTGILIGVLFALPSVYSESTVRSFASVIMFEPSLLRNGSVWRSAATWIDFAVIIDLVIGFMGMILSGLVVMQWPQVPMKVPLVLKTRNAIRRGLETDFAQAAADGAIFADTICAVVLVSGACGTESGRQMLVKRLNTLLTMFPPDSIFVVDSFPGSVAPVDSTWETVYATSSHLRYCFVPDSGSKYFALYWFNSVWLPFLVKSQHSQPFSHILLIDSLGADMSLPAVPMDISVPRDNLFLHANDIRGMYIPVRAVHGPEADGQSILVPWQDIEFKQRALLRLAESRALTTCVELESTVALWERDALFRAVRDVSGPSNAQLKMGLAIVKQRARNHTVMNPSSFAPVPVPSNMNRFVDFKLNNCPGVAAQIGIGLKELFSVFSLCNVYSWSVKPFLFLRVLVGGLVQILRPFVIGSLVFRDPVSIGLLAVAAGIFILAQELILLVVFSSRPDLRQNLSPSSIALFPVYRWFSAWIVEVPAFYKYVLWGCVADCSLKPEKRVKDLKDIPPCPLHPIVNWFTVWSQSSETNGPETLTNDFISRGSIDELSAGFPSPRNLQ